MSPMVPAGTTVSMLSPAQNAVMFVLQAEIFPVFAEWLRREHGVVVDDDPDWFDPGLIRGDLERSVRLLAQMILLQHQMLS
jgi:hypothetical protein